MMSIIQIRNVPEDVAEAIAEKARERHQTVAAYLRDLMAVDVQRELRTREMRKRTAALRQARSRMDLSRVPDAAGAVYVRQVRDEHERHGDERADA